MITLLSCLHRRLKEDAQLPSFVHVDLVDCHTFLSASIVPPYVTYPPSIICYLSRHYRNPISGTDKVPFHDVSSDS